MKLTRKALYATAWLASVLLLVVALFGASIFQVYQGGTGASSLTLHGILLGEGTAAVSSLTLGAHQVAVGATSADPSAKTVPDCQDTGGNHLNYTQSTDAFSCGTSSSGSGGGGSAGPLYDVFQCTLSDASGTSHTTINCSSQFNVASGETYLMFCAYFTNDGGTATLSGSDSLSGSTWTQDHSYYSSSAGGRMSVFRLTFSSSGSTTFTCTSSASKPFSTITVVKVVGITAVDTAVDKQSGAGIPTMISAAFTSSVAFADAYMMSFTGGTGSGCHLINQSGGIDILSNTVLGNFIGTKQLGPAGTYYLFAGASCNATWGNFVIVYK